MKLNVFEFHKLIIPSFEPLIKYCCLYSTIVLMQSLCSFNVLTLLNELIFQIIIVLSQEPLAKYSFWIALKQITELKCPYNEVIFV